MRSKPVVYLAGKTHGEFQAAYYTVRLKQLGRMENEGIHYTVEVFHKFMRVELKLFDRWEDALAHYDHWVKEKLPVQIALEALGHAGPLSSAIVDGQHRVHAQVMQLTPLA